MEYNFTFTLLEAGRTSAGVYQGDRLLRTLWSNEHYDAGTHSASFDGLNDEGRLLSNGAYTIKVLSNAINADSVLIIGNTSPFQKNNTHKGTNFITSICYAAGKIFYVNYSTEGRASQHYFDIDNIQTRQTILGDFYQMGQQTISNCTDGNTIYYLGTDYYFGTNQDFIFAIDATTLKEKLFAKGQPYTGNTNRTYQSVLLVGKNAGKNGCIAVQQNGNYLLFTDPVNHTLKVYNKKTFAAVSQLTDLTSCSSLAIDIAGNIWVAHQTNSTKQVSKIVIASNGSPSVTTTRLVLAYSVGGLAFSPTGDLCILDASTHVVRRYNTNTLQQISVQGVENGLLKDANLSYSKFSFKQTEGLLFLPNGTYWLLDRGNYRLIHFSAAGTYIEHIAYLSGRLEVQVDAHNPHRVHTVFLEYNVDFENNTWQLTRNYSHQLSADYKQASYFHIYKPTTLENGRTYASVWKASENCFKLVELTATGIRFIPDISILQNNGPAVINKNLDIIRTTEILEQGYSFFSRRRTAFANGNPVYAAEVHLVKSPPVDETDGQSDNSTAGLNPDCVTENGTYLKFISGVRNYNAKGFRPAIGYHLFGFKDSTAWLFKTAKATTPDYYGPMRTDARFDISTEVQYAATQVIVHRSHIIYVYGGEFWRQGQTNIINHYYENGLMLGQWGVVGGNGVPGSQRNADATDKQWMQMVGNSRIVAISEYDGDLILFQNDESMHDGTLMWRIKNTASIKLQEISLRISQKTGVYVEMYNAPDLANAYLAGIEQKSAVDFALPAKAGITGKVSARITSVLKIVQKGNFIFKLSTSGKAKLWIDGTVVFDRWKESANSWVSGMKELSEGSFPLQLEYSGNPGMIQLLWSGPGIKEQIIPAASLFLGSRPIFLSERINLLNGLQPGSAVVDNNRYGISYFPDQSSANRWLITSGTQSVKEDSEQSLSIFCEGPNQNRYLYFDLGNNTNLSSWSLNGTFDIKDLGWSDNNQYNSVRILDNKDNVIVELKYAPLDSTDIAQFVFYINETPLPEIRYSKRLLVMRDIAIICRKNKISLQLQGYKTVTVTKAIHSLANWTDPAKFGFFRSNGVDTKLSFQRLRFDRNIP